jgi:hypothetical protein
MHTCGTGYGRISYEKTCPVEWEMGSTIFWQLGTVSVEALRLV